MKHLVIPDTQVRPGVPIDHLGWIGRYIVDKKPDVVVHLGDFADMESLSTYDKGTKKHEGKRLLADIAASKRAMAVLLQPLKDHNKKCRETKHKQYKPKKYLTIGNHENRITRAANASSEMDGFLDISLLEYGKDWIVVPFLQVVELDGVQYAHYFPRNAVGKITQDTRGAPNAKAQAQREMKSSTAGHLQGLDTHIHQLQDRRVYSMIAGSCYLHEEDYLTPQGTKYWRGIIVKHGVKNGEYDCMQVSLDYLCQRYEGVPLADYEPRVFA